ncbi:MFS transporter [Burkholderia stabilis]|uniref:MFS transporter n=1 Tax=Burkholderia stabilis TaxID=95485 RepID=UPI0023EA57FC|nr:MFS transporter [Burkholderia stabilis]
MEPGNVLSDGHVGRWPVAYRVYSNCRIRSDRASWLDAGSTGRDWHVGGYLLAAGSAALLVPEFSWRALWLLGLPTGLLVVFLGRYIPESPRFIAAAGFESGACAVHGRFACAQASTPPESPAAIANGGEHPTSSRVQLLLGSHATITWCLILCGIAWGIVNFGFLLWLPTNLDSMGMDPVVTRWLLTNSAVLAFPGTAIAIWLYHRWSSIKALVLFIVLTSAALLTFFLLDLLHVRSTTAIALVTAAMLMGSSGIISMLIPYAAEVYPTHSRGTGTGLIAASSKLGGVLGACLVALGGGKLDQLFASPILVTVPLIVAAMLLVRYGVETRGRSLEDVNDTFAIVDRGICPRNPGHK